MFELVLVGIISGKALRSRTFEENKILKNNSYQKKL